MQYKNKNFHVAKRSEFIPPSRTPVMDVGCRVRSLVSVFITLCFDATFMVSVSAGPCSRVVRSTLFSQWIVVFFYGVVDPHWAASLIFSLTLPLSFNKNYVTCESNIYLIFYWKIPNYIWFFFLGIFQVLMQFLFISFDKECKWVGVLSLSKTDPKVN